MRNREHGRLPEQRTQVHTEQEDAQDKQNVVLALGKNMLETEQPYTSK